MNAQTDASRLLTGPFLDAREKPSCYAVTDVDLIDAGVKSPVMELSRRANEVARGLGKEKPVGFFSTSSKVKTAIESCDLWKLTRYDVKRVVSADAIRPAPVFSTLKCPACGTTVTCIEPRYLLPPCPNACNIHPSKWISKQDGYVDVASVSIIVDDRGRGQQSIRCYVDDVNLSINANYAKLQMASSGIGPVTIDAVPFIEWEGKDKLSFALWISRVFMKVEGVPKKPSIAEFAVDKEPTTEKDTVQAAFFANLPFMRALIGFHEFQLQRAFPDLIVRRYDGVKRVIEFEYDSRSFDAHGHDPAIVDCIICWTNNREKDDGIEVIELRKLVGKRIDVL
jgi:hypothetical protein